MQPGVCCCGIVDRWMMEPFKRHTHRQYEAVVWRSKPVKGLWRQRTLERRQMWRRRFLEHKPLESQVAQSVSGRKKEDETLFLHVRHNRMHTGRWMHTHADTHTPSHAHTHSQAKLCSYAAPGTSSSPTCVCCTQPYCTVRVSGTMGLTKKPTKKKHTHLVCPHTHTLKQICVNSSKAPQRPGSSSRI